MFDDPIAQSSGPGSPQSNWGTYHFKNGADVAKTDYKPSSDISNQCDSLLTQLREAVDRELEEVKDVIETFKVEVADPLSVFFWILWRPSRRPWHSAARLVKTVKNVLNVIFEMAKSILHTVRDSVETPIEFPIISWMYEKVTGKKEMSILDVFCLICAIPSTIMYKVFTGVAPFSDGGIIEKLLRLENSDSLLQYSPGFRAELISSGPASDDSSARPGRRLERVDGASRRPRLSGLPESAKKTILAIANLAVLPGFMLMMRFDRMRKNLPNTTPQSWAGVRGWRDASYQFLAEIMFNLPCGAWPITEIAGNDRSWPWIVNLNISAVSFSGRAFKAVMPSRIRWAVIDACFEIVFLVADAGYLTSLDEPATSDKWALTAEVFGLSAILLEVPVAVGLQAPKSG